MVITIITSKTLRRFSIVIYKQNLMYIGATNKNEMMKYNKYILCTENRNTLLKPPMLCATDTGEWYESESYF
jgi:hypothetical protein